MVDDRELEMMWGNAPIEEKNDFSILPEGKYAAKVEKCQYTETKEKRLPMFAWELIISEGQYAGRHIFHNRVLRDQDSVKWAKNEFARVGLKAETLAEMKIMLGEVLDKTVEIQLKNKEYQGKQIQNVFINKMAQEEEILF